MTCGRCRELCEEDDREFACQAREPCVELSVENVLAQEIWSAMQVLGAACWDLFELELTAEQRYGLRRRLMTVAVLQARNA